MKSRRALLLMLVFALALAITWAVWSSKPPPPDSGPPAGAQRASGSSSRRAADEVRAPTQPARQAGSSEDDGGPISEDAEEQEDAGPSIALRVRVEYEGEGIAGAEVVIEDDAVPPDWSGEVTTGDDGEVEIEIRPGGFVAYARSGARSGEQRGYTEGTRPTVRVDVFEAAGVEGTVLARGQGPLEGAEVSVGYTFRHTVSGSDGRYRLPVTATRVSLHAAKGGWVSQLRDVAPPPGQMLRCDFELERAHTVVFIATCDGERLDPISADFTRDGGRVPYDRLGNAEYGVAIGDYQVELTASRGRKRCKASLPIHVAGNTRVNATLVAGREFPEYPERPFDAGTAVKGHLTLSSKPVVQWNMKPGEERGTIVLTGPGEPHHFISLPAEVMLEPGRWHAKAMTPEGLGEGDVELRASEDAELTLELRRTGLAVTGRLVDARTHEAPGFAQTTVSIVFPYDPGEPTLFAGLKSDGRFALRQAPPGNAVLAVQVIGYPLLLRPLTLNGNLELGTLELTAGPEGILTAPAMGLTWHFAGGLPQVDSVASNGSALGFQAGDVLLQFARIELRGLPESDVLQASAGPLEQPVAVTLKRGVERLTLSVPRTARK